MTIRAFILVGLFGLVAVQAHAALRDSDNPTCPPLEGYFGPTNAQMKFNLDDTSGQRILIAEGRIDPGTAVHLSKAIAEAGSVDEVWIRSIGGDAAEGPKLGLVVRKAGLPTRVPEGWGCASACNFMFLGGVIRNIDPGGLYAVHMFTRTTVPGYQGQVDYDRKAAATDAVLRDIAEREQASALIASDQNDFMIRMGISRRLLTEVMYQQKAERFATTDRSTIRCLSSAQLRNYNVDNDD